MTENNKQKSDKEVAKENLEQKLYQNVFGSNDYAYSINAGERGADPWLQGAYDEVVGDDSFVKKRQEIYNSRKETYKGSRIYGDPSMPSDPDIVAGMVSDTHKSLHDISLKDLYEVMTSIDSNIKTYKLPEKGLELSVADIEKKAQEQGAIKENNGKKMLDVEKLDKETQEVYEALSTLRESYAESCQENLRTSRKQRALEALSKARDEKYHPKPEKKDSS